MTIKKIGHCCLLIKTSGLTILTDPGSYSTEQNTLTGIDVVLITHEHGDHFHTESVQEVLTHNPKAIVITNSGVGKKLDALKISYTVLEGASTLDVTGVAFAAFDGRHEEIFEEIGQVQNTGYLIDGALFFPGDSFHQPGVVVEILALPVAGPWCKIPDAIRYALAVKPKQAFPVHDAMNSSTLVNTILPKIFSEHGITFTGMKAGESHDFSL